MEEAVDSWQTEDFVDCWDRGCQSSAANSAAVQEPCLELAEESSLLVATKEEQAGHMHCWVRCKRNMTATVQIDCCTVRSHIDSDRQEAVAFSSRGGPAQRIQVDRDDRTPQT